MTVPLTFEKYGKLQRNFLKCSKRLVWSALLVAAFKTFETYKISWN